MMEVEGSTAGVKTYVLGSASIVLTEKETSGFGRPGMGPVPGFALMFTVCWAMYVCVPLLMVSVTLYGFAVEKACEAFIASAVAPSPKSQWKVCFAHENE